MNDTCPDCNSGLRPGATSCRCGWKLAVGAVDPAAIRYCATVGCEQKARVGALKCESCETRERQERSEARCRELGLTTVEEKRAYCRRMAKTAFNRTPSFVAWALKMQQRTLDLILLQGGKDAENTRRRLEELGVLGPDGKLLPVDQREEAMVAAREKRAEERAKLEAQLKAQGVVRREIDTEASA